MRVLVTGGTGYLGRAIVAALAAAGHDVALYARSASASGLPCQAFDGDIRDGERLFAAADGCEGVLHVAALVATWARRSRDFDDVNVGGLGQVLDVARRRNVGRVVYTSSFMALAPAGLDAPPAWNDYQRTKAAGDAVASRAAGRGAPIIRLYPGVIYGPGPVTEGNLVGGMVADHLKGRLPGLIGAGRIWSFSFVDDVAAAHVAALESGVPGARYLLGGEDAPQMRVFDIVRTLTGRQQPRRIPDWVASPVALAYELRASWFGVPPLLTTGTLEILLRDWPLGHERAADELGYRVTPLETGIARLVHAIQAAASVTNMFSENLRQVVHISMSAFALLLRLLTWWQAALCAVAAVVFNLFVLPRIGGRALSRPADARRGYPLGIVIYPVAVLLLILAFPSRLDIAASAWGVMACGDGAATLVGRRFGRRCLPWNPDKTFEGLAAFIAAGGAAGVFLSWWTAPALTPAPGLAFTLAAPIVAAFAAGLAETLPIQLDDNITVPVVAGSVLWLCSLMTGEAWLANRAEVGTNLVPALLVNTVAAVAGWRLGTVRVSGMLGGWAIGVAVYAGLGLPGWALLFATFGVATVTSKLGVTRKALLGIAEERGGRRGGGNAFANTGLAAVAAVAAVTTPFHQGAALAFVAALAAGGGDTVASEIGKAWGGRTYLPLTLAQVRPGTPGAVSLEGSAAGVIGAMVLAAFGAWLGLVPWWMVWAATAGAIAGSVVESALASTLEASRIVNNDVLNFMNTASGAAVALAIMRLL